METLEAENQQPVLFPPHFLRLVRVRNTIPNVAKEGLKPFDFVSVATKNIADVGPTVSEIIVPAVTSGHSTIALIRNGLNIEKPLIATFPKNVILSGVSLIEATEIKPGSILHDDHDHLVIGPSSTPTTHMLSNSRQPRNSCKSTTHPVKPTAS